MKRITFKRIIRSRSTEDFSGIPYVMTLLNCLLSAWLVQKNPRNIILSIKNFDFQLIILQNMAD